MTATTAGELAGMAVRLVNVRFGDRAVRSEAMVTSLAGPARGHVKGGDEGSTRRERCFPSPGSSRRRACPARRCHGRRRRAGRAQNR
jgi:hypothetical protein